MSLMDKATILYDQGGRNKIRSFPKIPPQCDYHDGVKKAKFVLYQVIDEVPNNRGFNFKVHHKHFLGLRLNQNEEFGGSLRRRIKKAISERSEVLSDSIIKEAASGECIYFRGKIIAYELNKDSDLSILRNVYVKGLDGGIIGFRTSYPDLEKIISEAA